MAGQQHIVLARNIVALSRGFILLSGYHDRRTHRGQEALLVYEMTSITPPPVIPPSTPPAKPPPSAPGGWRLVRRAAPSNGEWGPANDHLGGTSVYGTASTDPLSDSTFSVEFGQFTEFRLSSGDGQWWLETDKEELIGSFYSSSERMIKASSISTTPYTGSQTSYNRETYDVDPIIWIASSSDTGSCQASGDGPIFCSLNCGNSHTGPGCAASFNVWATHGGMNVWVR